MNEPVLPSSMTWTDLIVVREVAVQSASRAAAGFDSRYSPEYMAEWIVRTARKLEEYMLEGLPR